MRYIKWKRPSEGNELDSPILTIQSHCVPIWNILIFVNRSRKGRSDYRGWSEIKFAVRFIRHNFCFHYTILDSFYVVKHPSTGFFFLLWRYCFFFKRQKSLLLSSAIYRSSRYPSWSFLSLYIGGQKNQKRFIFSIFSIIQAVVVACILKRKNASAISLFTFWRNEKCWTQCSFKYR